MMNRYHTAHMTIDEHYGDSVRLVGVCRPENAPIGMTEAMLTIDDDDDDTKTRDIGPYPAKVGAFWSDQPRGQAGYYLLFGPIPIAELGSHWERESREYAAMRQYCEEIDA